MFLPHDRLVGLSARYRALIALVLPAVLCASFVSAQEAAPRNLKQAAASQESITIPTDIPIEMSGERMSGNIEKKTYTFQGNVTLRQGNMRLRADSITFDGNKGELTAEGKVIIRMGGDVVEADKITIKIPGATGVL